MTELDEEAAALQRRFGRPGAVDFAVSPLGGVVIHLTAGGATATVALQGAQVLSWIPQAGAPDALWCSPLSKLGTGKPVRGGIPICWPWFGLHPFVPASQPAHGLVRAAPWSVESTGTGETGSWAVFNMSLTPQQQAFAGMLTAALRVTLAEKLTLELVSHNAGSAPVAISEALHTYFAIGDIGRVRVEGLEGRTYLDQLTKMEAEQRGPITFDRETDRIYWDTGGALPAIKDDGLARSIALSASGSKSTVVWNPWSEKAARLGDIPEEGYRQMLCVETANVGPRNAVTVSAGKSHTLSCSLTATKI